VYKESDLMMKKHVYILTFDIEEWFNLLDFDATRSVEKWDAFECRIHENTDRILNLLNKKKQKATFFCVGWIAERYPEVIKKISDYGFEIASHSCNHQLAYELTKEEFRDDLQKSIGLLKGITGKPVTSYRVPGFSITRDNSWALTILIENGILFDSSIFPAPRGHGGFDNFGTDKPVILEAESGMLKEFPINTVPFFGKQIIFSGGGYFRLLPYPLIKKFMLQSEYVMTYFHPRDFDSKQPVLQGLSAARKFKSYYGLKGAFSKLEKLLDSFNFTDISTADTQISWQSMKLNDILQRS
jgi:polysaccharide deacetylase family protein (PEP-CTERM system associated)